MTPTQYGVKYAGGGYTGPITESYRLAVAYAKDYDGTVYVVGSKDDPDLQQG